MAKRSEKARIWELFKRGVTVLEIEKTSTINRRTLYRWFADFQAEHCSESTNINNEIKEIQVTTENYINTELNNVDFDSGWVEFATRKALEGCLVNGAIAQRLSDLMHLEISQKNPNYKNISCISQALNTHYRLQHLFGMFHLLDVNKAVQLLESSGYTVVASVE
jgi:hypothetical protein